MNARALAGKTSAMCCTMVMMVRIHNNLINFHARVDITPLIQDTKPDKTKTVNT